MTDVQPTLFDTAPASARGPRQSQLTVDSLGRDTTLKYRIALATVNCSGRLIAGPSGTNIICYDRPVTDDDITEWLENHIGHRFQRNVIARTRGLMETAGWFLQVPDVTGRTGRPTHAIVPTMVTVKEITVGT